MTVHHSLRSFATAIAVCAGLLFSADTAAAHGANGQPIPDANHYLAQVTTITPPQAGISATIDPRGEWIQVDNETTQTLTILGYSREPYIQISSIGVAENLYSPSYALNQSLFGDGVQNGSENLPPSWQHTSDGRIARWHDHRIHWMGADRPPAVKANPRQNHPVGNWVIHMSLAGKPVDITGSLSWLAITAPNTVLTTKNKIFLAADTATFILAVAGVAWFLHRRRRTAPEPSLRTARLRASQLNNGPLPKRAAH